MDLYAQELRVWKECRAVRDGGREDAGGEGDGEGKCRVPGAFEW